jgi:glyoxylase-like metal-dependent hydrolase (beta-lactamase superfamily II)
MTKFGYSPVRQRGGAHEQQRIGRVHRHLAERRRRHAGSERASFTYATAHASDRARNATPGRDPRQGEPMLTQVADGVWVRQSEWVWTNSIVVRGEDGLILIDPGIDGSELNQLADDLDRLGIPVVAGFSTHPHWDHLLWHPRFGEVPRYATAATAHVASQARERAQAMAAESASGIPLDLVALVTPLPADGGPVPGEIIEHQAHAVGHAAVLLADRGVLLAGDMLSDVLIPLFDPRQDDQVGAYETALDRLEEAAGHVDVVVPGHGTVAEGLEVAARLAADRAYIEALRRGEDPVDARLGPDADWLSGPHQANLERARGR